MAAFDPNERTNDRELEPLQTTVPQTTAPQLGRPLADQPATDQPSADLPVSVFRPAPEELVMVAGRCHARSLCLSAGVAPQGVVAVFVDPCGALLAIATAPAAVVTAMLVDPAPFARLAEQLSASRIYLEVPTAHARALGDALAAELWPLCIATVLLARPETA